MLDEILKKVDSANEAKEELQRQIVKGIAEKFLPLYKENPGQQRYVSIQGDPVHEDDPELIIREARRNRAVSENICCKVPSTECSISYSF
jgi:transaldolase